MGDCWRWFPRLKLAEEDLEYQLGFSKRYNKEDKTYVIKMYGLTEECHEYKLEGCRYDSEIGLKKGDGKIVSSLVYLSFDVVKFTLKLFVGRKKN